MHNLWQAIKRLDLGIVGIEEEELYVKRRENIFTVTTPKHPPNLGKISKSKHKKHIEYQIDRARKRKPPNYNVVKMLNIQNKDIILRAVRETQNHILSQVH